MDSVSDLTIKEKAKKKEKEIAVNYMIRLS